MAIWLRDPLMREILLDDYERSRMLRPYQHPYHVRRPVHVHRQADWPLATTFDGALQNLHSVLQNLDHVMANSQGTRDSAGGLKINRTEDGNLQVAVDVAQYKPEEVNVKLCDGHLVVEAKTESSENDSYHKSEFKRWIKLPADVKQEGIKSSLSPEGRLMIDVPVNKPIGESKSRSIPIDVQKPEAIEKEETKAKKQ